MNERKTTGSWLGKMVLFLGAAFSAAALSVFAQAPDNPFAAPPAPAATPAAAEAAANPFAAPVAPAADAASAPGATANPFALTPAPGAAAPAANPFALPGTAVPAAAASAPASAPTETAASAPAAQQNQSGFGNPFANIFGRGRTVQRQQPRPGQSAGGATSQAVAQTQQFRPPHELIIQMRKALAEERYSDIKALADQYAVVDPQSGLADFFVAMARLLRDSATQRKEVGGLFLAQYGMSRTSTTMPTGVASGTSATQPTEVASDMPTSLPIAAVAPEATATLAEVAAVPPAQPTPGVAEPIAPVPPAPTPSVDSAVAPVAPAPVAPVAVVEAEPFWKPYLIPGAIALGVLVLLGLVLSVLRGRRKKAVAAEAVVEAPVVAVPFAAEATEDDSDPVLMGAPAEAESSIDAFDALTPEPTGPTEMFAGSSFEEPKIDSGFGDLTFESEPQPTGALPVEPAESLLTPADSGVLEIGESLRQPEEETVVSAKADSGVDDLLAFIPSEPEEVQDQPSQINFDLDSMDVTAVSEAPSRDESIGGLNFEDLLSASPAPSNMPSAGLESSLSLNDIASQGSRSEGPASSLSFDDLVISPKSSPGDESLSSLDLNNLEIPSAPPLEEDSFISDFDEVGSGSDVASAPPVDVSATKGFHEQFENLMFNTPAPPPDVEDTAAQTQQGKVGESTTGTGSKASTKPAWPASLDDTQPSDLGLEMEERTSERSKAETQRDTRSGASTKSDVTTADTGLETPLPPPIDPEDTVPPPFTR